MIPPLDVVLRDMYVLAKIALNSAQYTAFSATMALRNGFKSSVRKTTIQKGIIDGT
jgi:hypothetical protein